MNARLITTSLVAIAMLLATPARAQEPDAPHLGGKVLLLGDSNMFGALGHALTRSFRGLGWNVARRGKPGSGIARPDFFDWPQEAERLIRKHEPDVVVIIFGGNDGQRLRDHRGRYADGIPWDDEQEWSREYRARLRSLMASLTAASTRVQRVFVLSPTNRRPRKARARMRRIMTLQREVVREFPRAVWVDAYSLSSDDKGHYVAFGPDEKGRRAPYRKRDGIHLTRAGATSLARRVLPVLLSWMR